VQVLRQDAHVGIPHNVHLPDAALPGQQQRHGLRWGVHRGTGKSVHRYLRARPREANARAMCTCMASCPAPQGLSCTGPLHLFLHCFQTLQRHVMLHLATTLPSTLFCARGSPGSGRARTGSLCTSQGPRSGQVAEKALRSSPSVSPVPRQHGRGQAPPDTTMRSHMNTALGPDCPGSAGECHKCTEGTHLTGLAPLAPFPVHHNAPLPGREAPGSLPAEGQKEEGEMLLPLPAWL